MRMHRETRSRRGSALVLSIIAVTVVSILAAAFMQLALRVTRRLSSSSDTHQAMNIAEAGLAEAYTGIGVARTGNIGSAAAPALFGGGLLWVEATHHANGMIELASTAMYGTGRASLGLVCEPVMTSVAQLGFFTLDDLRLNPDVRLDSYDSSLGTYQSQVNTALNNQGIVGSNGDVSIASGNQIFGDVIAGPSGEIDVASGAVVTGGQSQRPAVEVLPPVETPPIALAKPMKYTSGTPMVVPPGEAGFESLQIGKDTKLILKGPLTVVFGKLETSLNSEVVFDTTDGPIEMYITDTLDFNSGSLVSTTTQKTSDTIIMVAAPEGKNINFGAKSQFYGFIYAPTSEVHISAKYELYGGVVCKSLQLAAQGKMHADLSLGATLESTLPRLHAWRVVDLPQQIAARRMDPFNVLGLDPDTLLPLAQSHEDQTLEVRYVATDGSVDTFFGPESDFDWSLVKELLYGVRDGLAFFLPDDYVDPGQIGNDPLLDLVASTMTSKQLREALLAAKPVSSEVLAAACLRDPPMNKGDLEAVLKAHYPLDATSLLAAVGSPSLDSKALKNVLIDNSPLPLDVMTSVLLRNPPMSASDLTKVLIAQ